MGHVTNEHVRRKIQTANGKYDKLLTLETEVGQSHLNSGLAKTILHGTVKGKRRKDRQKKNWKDNIKKWTGMDFGSSTRAPKGKDSCKVICGAPTALQSYGI